MVSQHRICFGTRCFSIRGDQTVQEVLQGFQTLLKIYQKKSRPFWRDDPFEIGTAKGCLMWVGERQNWEGNVGLGSWHQGPGPILPGSGTSTEPKPSAFAVARLGKHEIVDWRESRRTWATDQSHALIEKIEKQHSSLSIMKTVVFKWFYMLSGWNWKGLANLLGTTVKKTNLIIIFVFKILKMNIFRFVADMLHLGAILILLYRIRKSRNCIGKSNTKLKFTLGLGIQ